jgi:hypothetical protein
MLCFTTSIFVCSSCSSVSEEHLMDPCLFVTFFKTVELEVSLLESSVAQQWDPRVPIVGTHCYASVTWDHISATRPV